MAKIIPFPKRPRQRTSALAPLCAISMSTSGATKRHTVFSILIASLWVLTVFLSPLIKLIALVDLFVLGVQTIYFWNTPDRHEGFIFLLHGAGYLALVFFTFFYGHKKFEQGFYERNASNNHSSVETL